MPLGPIRFAGTVNGSYQRHLLFYNVVNAGSADDVAQALRFGTSA